MHRIVCRGNWIALLSSLLIISLLTITGCGMSSTAVTGSQKTVTSLTVTPGAASVAVGATQQFVATAKYSDGTTADVSSTAAWTTAKTTVANVSSAGMATGVAVGSAAVTALLGGVSGSATLTVTAAQKTLQSIAVIPASATVVAGGTQAFTATGTYGDGSTAAITSSVTWASANTAVATVNASGVATGVGIGSVAITASLGAVSGSATLAVTPAQKTLMSIAVTPVNASLVAGTTQQFVATGTYSDGTTASLGSGVTWTSSNVAVATINASGDATGIAAGTATMTASFGGMSGSATLTVTAKTVTAVTVSPTSGSVMEGQTQQFMAMAKYSDGSTANASSTATWTSSNTAVATVNTAGVATGVAAGTATVTASFSGLSGSAILTVTAAPAPTVSITASSTSISASTSITLTVTATNATSVVITGSNGTSYTLPGVGGTQVVSPAASTTYTATATGNGGKATTKISVTVTPDPAPSITIVANPASVTVSNSSLLTISAAHATTVTVTGGGVTYNLPASGGTQAVSPTTSTTYTATATGPGGTATSSATVTVVPNPTPTVTITASPAGIVDGSSSTLTIDATNSTSVVLTGSDGSKMTLPSSNTTETVSPTTTTTYTATATGPGGTTSANATITVTSSPTATVAISADPSTISSGHSSTLTVTASNAVQITLTGSDGSTYSLSTSGGTQVVTPTSTTGYTVTVTGAGGQQTQQSATVIVVAPGTVDDVDHVVFMLQENHSFDNYFGMLNPYRAAMSTNGVPWNVGADGNTYNVDGIDDKLTTLSNQNDSGTVYHPFKFTSTCIDDESSAWLESYGDVNRYDFLADRPINMDGFVHTAEGFAISCQASGTCSGTFTDTNGQRAMGYYDQTFLNYYYYMASQFALSDRWFSPISSKSIDNRIATFTGGTTQGLTADPGNNDALPQLAIPTIFGEMKQANASWKIYYTVTQGECTNEDDCSTTGNARYPGTNFSALQESYTYLHEPSVAEQQSGCTPPTISSNNPITGDSTGSFCVDPTHIAPLSQFFADISNGSLPDFSFIEAGYGNNDEHPGSGQSLLAGQTQVSKILQGFMASPAWKDSVFFLSYDEDGGPYDHVPPVPGHSNDFTDASLGAIPDISSIAVNPDSYFPCVPASPGTPTLHCDLTATEPGANPGDAAAQQGFAAQLGFRVPNMVVSPFTRQHYVSHIPMDHTAVIRFVENRFIGSNAHLTARDAAQPSLLNFFNFSAPPLATPPSPPAPYSDPTGATCTPANFAPTTP